MNRDALSSRIIVTVFTVTICLVLLTTFSIKCQTISTKDLKEDNRMSDKLIESIYFGNGCFWCTEAVFKELKGVLNVESGYAGGTVKNPTYREVCNGTTGHAEVVHVIFDPTKISLKELLEVYFFTHDPTTLNRQGNDVGTQYRSVIFYTKTVQKEEAESYIKKLDELKVFPRPIVTKVEAFRNYYPAENYHQSYYELNGHEPYCQIMITPKLDKLKKDFKTLIK